MDWKEITTESELDQLLKSSNERSQVIYKHSTRCNISSVAKNRLESNNSPADIDFHYLDLITYRNLSDKIAELFDVWHESPQVLLIRNGKCIYHESHLAIRMDDIIHENKSLAPH